MLIYQKWAILVYSRVTVRDQERYMTRYMFRGQTFLCHNVLTEIYTKNSNSKNASTH